MLIVSASDFPTRKQLQPVRVPATPERSQMIGMVRKLNFAIPLLLALAVPYVLLSDSTAPLRESVSSVLAANGEQEAAADPVLDLLETSSTFLPPANATAAGSAIPQPLDLPSALRFDITPRWVLSRWPSVTTTHSEQQFDGLRVPLITGTGPYDLAGSLTYYFDQQSQVQRISFLGYTADERLMVSVVTRQFGMQLKPSVNATIYLNSWNGKPTSALIIRRRAVVQNTSESRNYEVHLEINRPNDYFGLSAQFEQLLTTATAGKPTTAQVR